MDIYDILRRLVEARPFQQHEQQESIEVIEELRSLNVFGTLSKITKVEHEHDDVAIGPNRVRCRICTEERDIV